ncbi:GNAT family N-acetyltransferase [Paenibacillus xanthanilyticus]|uniref:GNAT family N-acetyltransferase n=1 Tax=Paenibacillus xanthanilyticus TaxID=1783531 RepID=A0ABV8KC61_9BACL
MTVKQAELADLDEVAALFNAYRVFYGQQPDLEGARGFLFDRLVYRQSVVWIARDEASGEAAGFTQLYPIFSSVSMERVLVLNDLFVTEAHRKLGVGQRLLDAAKSYAVSVKAKGLQLSTAVDNAAAQRLYERNGYERDELYCHYFLRTNG